MKYQWKYISRFIFKFISQMLVGHNQVLDVDIEKVLFANDVGLQLITELAVARESTDRCKSCQVGIRG
jgi:hypothetical protein